MLMKIIRVFLKGGEASFILNNTAKVTNMFHIYNFFKHKIFNNEHVLKHKKIKSKERSKRCYFSALACKITL